MAILIAFVLAMVVHPPTARTQSNEWVRLFRKHSESVGLNPINSKVLFVGTCNTLYRSDDGGHSWYPIYQFAGMGLIRQIIIPVSDTNIMLVVFKTPQAKSRLYRSSNSGCNFRELDFEAGSGNAISMIDNRLFIPAQHSVVMYESTDLGKTWNPCTKDTSFSSSQQFNCCSMAFRCAGRDHFLVGTGRGQIWTWDGIEWYNSFAAPNPGSNEVPQFDITTDGKMYAITVEGDGYHQHGLLFSSDSGATWKPVKSPSNLWSITHKRTGHYLIVSQYLIVDQQYPVSSVMFSDDNEKSWVPIGNHKEELIWSIKLSNDESTLYLAGEKGVFAYSLSDLQ